MYKNVNILQNYISAYINIYEHIKVLVYSYLPQKEKNKNQKKVKNVKIFVYKTQ